MEQVEIWVPIFDDPLPNQEIEVYSTCVDYDIMDFQALLEGPQDEHDIDKLLNGAFNPTYLNEAKFTHEIGCKFYSRTSDHGMTIQTLAPAPLEVLREKKEAPATTVLSGGGGGGGEEEMREGAGSSYPPPCHRRSRRLVPTTTLPEEGACGLLDYMAKSGWRHRGRARSARKRGTWSINTEPCSRDLRSAGKGQKHGCRRNNDHWTFEEVKELVDGISVYGVGHWAKLKNERFRTSVRTAEHLKDKWRNLLKAYTGNANRRISPPLDRDCVKKIQRLAADYPRK
uniref:Myb-like domain-containing protein n=2 Tax=Hordeum vulgare subsp. vulgare TaxID=112509 RepID=A0A8I6YUQ0_HORVV